MHTQQPAIASIYKIHMQAKFYLLNLYKINVEMESTNTLGERELNGGIVYDPFVVK